MRRFLGRLLSSLALVAVATLPARAQETAATVDVGQVAPDFSLPGATRYGPLREPTRLSDFKGKTVVLAFFFRARTKG